MSRQRLRRNTRANDANTFGFCSRKPVSGPDPDPDPSTNPNPDPLNGLPWVSHTLCPTTSLRPVLALVLPPPW